MAHVRLDHVGKSFGAVTVLKDINLEIGDREFAVFVGPSGCGKSTLLRMIAGLEDVTEGSVEIDGRIVNDTPPAQREIAMVFQSYALYPHKSVRDNLGFGLRMAKVDKAEIKRKVVEAARVLEIEDLLDRRPKELSGGQRQRVAIGRAIVRKPRLFLFDEPLSNLDAALRGQMRIEIARLHQALKATMIYVTHDQVEAMTLADKIVVLNAGRVEQVGGPLDLYERPANLFVAGFIGAPKMNFLSARVTSVSDGAASVSLRDGEAFVYPLAPGARATSGETVTVGVRPQHLVAAPRTLTLAAEVQVVERLGAETHVLLQLKGGETVMACLDGRAEVEVGAPMQVGADVADCHLFDSRGLAIESLLRRRPTPIPLISVRNIPA